MKWKATPTHVTLHYIYITLPVRLQSEALGIAKKLQVMEDCGNEENVASKPPATRALLDILDPTKVYHTGPLSQANPIIFQISGAPVFVVLTPSPHSWCPCLAALLLPGNADCPPA